MGREVDQLEAHLFVRIERNCRDDRYPSATAATQQGEHGDAYQGAREDLAIWKRRAQEAEEKLRAYDQRIGGLGVLAMQSAPQQAERLFGNEEHVFIPRGLIGAASSAIDKKRDAPNILAELRRYTVGDLAQQPGYMAGAPLLSTAAQDVLAERNRQIAAEGWTPEHDDEHTFGSLASAAGCYAMYTLAYPAGDPHPNWPWERTWWKPSQDSRRNLIRAGALILAEIERLDRAAAKSAEQEQQP